MYGTFKWIISGPFFIGASVGTVIIFPMSGVLADAYGWRSIFYATGAAGLLWCLFWAILVFDSPQDHPWISEEEREFIVRSIAVEKGEKEVTSTPWREILTCPAVWALTFGHASSNWGNYQLNTMMPTYLDSVLK